MVKTSDIKPDTDNGSVLKRIQKTFDKLLDKMSATENPDKEPVPTTPSEVVKFSTQQQIEAASKGDKGIDY